MLDHNDDGILSFTEPVIVCMLCLLLFIKLISYGLIIVEAVGEPVQCTGLLYVLCQTLFCNCSYYAKFE